nr:MAG TPA: hypothetical protein [Caudoviricetes sp.]
MFAQLSEYERFLLPKKISVFLRHIFKFCVSSHLVDIVTRNL